MIKFRFRELKTIPLNHTPNKRKSQDWSQDCLLSEPSALHHYTISPFKLITVWGNGPKAIAWNLIGMNTWPNMSVKTTTTKIAVNDTSGEQARCSLITEPVVWLHDFKHNWAGNGGSALRQVVENTVWKKEVNNSSYSGWSEDTWTITSGSRQHILRGIFTS